MAQGVGGRQDHQPSECQRHPGAACGGREWRLQERSPPSPGLGPSHPKATVWAHLTCAAMSCAAGSAEARNEAGNHARFGIGTRKSGGSHLPSSVAVCRLPVQRIGWEAGVIHGPVVVQGSSWHTRASKSLLVALHVLQIVSHRLNDAREATTPTPFLPEDIDIATASTISSPLA